MIRFVKLNNRINTQIYVLIDATLDYDIHETRYVFKNLHYHIKIYILKTSNAFSNCAVEENKYLLTQLQITL